jgi:hypothetical protein
LFDSHALRLGANVMVPVPLHGQGKVQQHSTGAVADNNLAMHLVVFASRPGLAAAVMLFQPMWHVLLCAFDSCSSTTCSPIQAVAAG